MAVYLLKRKSFTQDNEKKRSWKKKLAIGAGIAGTAAAGIYAAKKGWLGSGLQKSTNDAWMKAGNKIGSQKMMESGKKGYASAAYKQNKQNVIVAGKNIDEARLRSAAEAQAANRLSRHQKTGVWSDEAQSIFKNAKTIQATNKDIAKTRSDIKTAMGKSKNPVFKNPRVQEKINKMMS